MEEESFFDINPNVLEEFENEIDVLLNNSKSLDENSVFELAFYASKFDILYEDFSNMLIDVVVDSIHFPNKKFWRFEPFSDVMQELKLSMQPKDVQKKYKVPFSFGDYDTRNIIDIRYIASQVDSFDKYDVDNFIGLVPFFNYNDFQYPVNFENRLIDSIRRNGYAIECYGKHNFSISKLGISNNLYSLQNYLESTIERKG